MAEKKNKKMSKKAEGHPPLAIEASDVEPEISPYLSPSCKIYCQNDRPFLIPRDHIRAVVELDKLCSKSNEIHLSNLPDKAGHVLVHYLYTGTWQNLCGRESLRDSRNAALFKVSVHVYAAARMYGIPGLIELAKENISRFAEALSALDIIVLAAGACELLQDNDLWRLVFIKVRMQQLYEDPASFDQSVFLGCFGSITMFSRMLVKTMIEICCERSTSHAHRESFAAPDHVTPSTNSPQETLESDPDTDLQPPMDYAIDAGPWPAECHTPSASTDCPLEYEAGAAVEAVAECEAEPQGEATAEPEPVESSSFAWEPAAEPREEAEPDERVPSSKKLKKSKKEKKKKKSGIADTDEPKPVEAAAEAPAPIVEAEPDGWGLLVKKSNKKKKQDELAIPEADATRPGIIPEVVASTDFAWEPTVEEVAEILPDEWPVSKKKSKKDERLPEACGTMAAHVVDGGWEGCPSCSEFVCKLSARYQSTFPNTG